MKMYNSNFNNLKEKNIISKSASCSFIPIDIGNYIIKIAETKLEIKHAQSLRYSIFYKEKKVKPSLSQKLFKRDFDNFDQISDHLIIIDKNKSKNNIVGTYRLLKGSMVKVNKGFYSEKEFDLSNIKNVFSKESILELGRSCVHSNYRSGLILKLLWQGIAQYVLTNNIKLLIGCASFPVIDINRISNQLIYLKNNHSLPHKLSVFSNQRNRIFPKFKDKRYTDKNTFKNLPPLIKGYISLGGMFSQDYYIDHQLNTIDICVVVLIEKIAHKYKKKFLH